MSESKSKSSGCDRPSSRLMTFLVMFCTSPGGDDEEEKTTIGE